MNNFPDNKTFAFSIFDDTDLSTVENIGPLYHLLEEIGIRTTKSVWPLASAEAARFGGSSLQDSEYLAFVLGLKEAGFEIALHNVRNTCSTRGEVQHCPLVSGDDSVESSFLRGTRRGLEILLG